ncbi:MAG TPA: CatB-related O-acetyltransferase [Solirubrobacteraceae bacterium]|nr:CatB-related O-acetyltransferase [Solirubrobacteraceae bacterium]
MSRRQARRLGPLRDLLGRQVDAVWSRYGEHRAHAARQALDEALYSSERLTMGRCSYGEPLVATFPGDSAHVRIGAFCSIGPDVILMDGGDHRTDWVSTFPFRARLGLPGAYEDGHPRSRGDIEVGNDVWIGRGARVRSGVSIGNGAVVASYAVVTRHVRPYAVVAGVPAREVRRRLRDEQVQALERIAWWEWPMDTIEARVAQLCSDDVEAFIREHLAT